jgi:DNA ligase-1
MTAFAEVADCFARLEATSGRREMIELLASLFNQLDRDEVQPVVYLCQGRVAPFYVPLEIGMGERTVAEAIAQAAGTEREAVNTEYARVGDLGLVAEDLLGRGSRPAAVGPSVREVHQRLDAIASTTGPGSVEAKVGAFVALLREVNPLAARYLVRIPLGQLRLGIGDVTVLDALSQARAGTRADRTTLEAAYNRTSDLGMIARAYWDGGVGAVAHIPVQVGKPIRPALAERLPSPEAVLDRLGRCAAEPKFDGFRCQIHKDGDDVRVFSRNLEDLTPMFPEIVAGVRVQVAAQSAILDGEAVAYNPASEQYLPFQETTRRRRKHGIEEMAASIPLRLFAFDVMLCNGEDVTARSYRERRALLERLVLAGDVLLLAAKIETDDPSELRNFLLTSVQDGLEGIVAKKLDAPYQAGGRNLNWVKLKRNVETQLQDTVDCVILGYIYGRGKRAELGAGALLVGVYDQARDVFVSVSKIGTGLSDADWREIRERCDRIAVPHRPARVDSILEPSVWVEPSVVIEVLADEITRSPVHIAGRTNEGLGYALRFPRLVRFREADKRPEDATTVDEIVEMYRRQAVKAI